MRILPSVFKPWGKQPLSKPWLNEEVAESILSQVMLRLEYLPMLTMIHLKFLNALCYVRHFRMYWIDLSLLLTRDAVFVFLITVQGFSWKDILSGLLAFEWPAKDQVFHIENVTVGCPRLIQQLILAIVMLDFFLFFFSVLPLMPLNRFKIGIMSQLKWEILGSPRKIFVFPLCVVSLDNYTRSEVPQAISPLKSRHLFNHVETL